MIDNELSSVYTVYIQLGNQGGVTMKIIISNASDKPIYEQITLQLKNAMVKGDLKSGEALPSIRMLAKDLKISVMTTKRAYSDLEKDGFIETVPGKGSFVAERNRQFMLEEYQREIESHLQKALDLAKTAGIDRQDLIEILNFLGEENIHE